MELLNLNEDSELDPELDPKLVELFGEDNITSMPGAYLIPQLGVNSWDGHIYVSGATGAGKSYLIRQIVENDLKNRKVYLFSEVNDDPSLSGLFLNTYNEGVDSLDDSICIFDDYQDNKLRDSLLEKGRHKNSVVICVNHKHRQWRDTMKPLNESKYVILFPSANKGTAINEMRMLGMNNKQRNAIVEWSASKGRYMIIHQHAPNAVICAQGIVKL
jgi:hypothetical protein